MNFKHGLATKNNVHRLHSIWRGIKKRCLTKSVIAYKDYGGRGINISNEWLEFINFYNWSLNNGYADNLSIDRINNEGGYEPTNCRWVTRQLQARNRRSSRLIEYKGETLTLAEWSDILNIKYATLHARIKAGTPLHEAFQKSLPIKEKKEKPIKISKPRIVKGYSFDKSINKYRAESWKGGKKKYIGVFVKEEDAAEAYKEYITNWKSLV
jgi:hypothetical protein